ncbi:hypothetical protein ACFL6Y_10925 [Elusimicrobiota bacterium]
MIKKILIGFLAFLCAHPFIFAQETKKVKIFYTRGWRYSVSLDLVEPLEDLLTKDAKRIRLKKITNGKVYFSNGLYLMDAPLDLKSKHLPKRTALKNIKDEVDILETTRSISFAYPKTYYPIMKKLALVDPDNESQGYYSGITRRKGFLGAIKGSIGEELGAVSIDKDSKQREWRPSIMMKYHLDVDGKDTVISVIGKPLGGPSRIKKALSEKLRQTRENTILLLVGSMIFPAEIIGEENSDSALNALRELGFNTWAPDYNDLVGGWKTVLAKLNRKDTQKPDLLISNIKSLNKDTLLPKSWMVREIDGIKLGIFALLPDRANAFLEKVKAGYRIEGPVQTARNMVRDLGKNQKVDVIICISHLKREEEANLRFMVPGIDILLGDYTDDATTTRRTRVDLKNWNKERHWKPAYYGLTSTYGFGEIDLGFIKDTTGYELVSVEEELRAMTADDPSDKDLLGLEEKSLEFFSKPQSSVLTDPRTLWPESKITYDPAEFYNLAAQILRFETNTEVAILKINRLSGNAPGKVSESYVKNWLFPEERIAIMKLRGSALRSLLKHFAFEDIPVDPNVVRHAKYASKTYLAGAGVDRQARVSGMPIKDSEIYSVALTEDLLKDNELYELKSGQNIKFQGRTHKQAILGWLKNRRARKHREIDRLYSKALRRELGKGALSKISQDYRLKEKIDETFTKSKEEAEATALRHYNDEVRSFCEGKTPRKPVWRINLRKMSAQFANTQVQNTEQYNQVSDARAQAANQVFSRGTMQLFSEVYVDKFRWDSGFTADYGKLTLNPQGLGTVKSETIDQFVVENEFKYHLFYLNKGFLNGSIGPYLNISYETEFTKPALITFIYPLL